MDASRLLLALALLSGSLRPGRSLEEALGSRELLAEEPNAYPERFLDWMVSGPEGNAGLFRPAVWFLPPSRLSFKGKF